MIDVVSATSSSTASMGQELNKAVVTPNSTSEPLVEVSDRKGGQRLQIC